MVFNFRTFSFPGSNSAEEPSSVARDFSLQQLQVATVNFWRENILETGVTGTMYSGRLPNGTLIAVKRLRRKEQFLREKEAGSSGLYQDTSPIIGFCISGEEHILVYPLPIHDRQKRIGRILRALGWQTRKHPPVCLVSHANSCDPGTIIRRDLDASGELLERNLNGQTPAVPQLISWSWRDRLRSFLLIPKLSDRTGSHLIQCSSGAFTLTLIFCIYFVLGFVIF